MRSLINCAILLFCAMLSYAQDYSGTYILSTSGSQVTLIIARNETGTYSGTLSGNNNVFKLTGQLQNGLLSGTIGEAGSGLFFTAQLQNQMLVFTMAEKDYYGNLNQATARVMSFVRSAEKAGNVTGKTGDVIINNTILTRAQIQEIVSKYGIEPKPGNYWYDSKSGLYGVKGYPSFGFMYPGHNFGELSRDASSGNTGVIINSRELPQLEWAVWSYMLGYYIQPGSYWLDAQGNAGYEGSTIPVVNLFVAARQNSYAGQGSGGDNFWSSRFSAGNSNQDNSQGYVSVPGYGPVGYGF